MTRVGVLALLAHLGGCQEYGVGSKPADPAAPCPGDASAPALGDQDADGLDDCLHCTADRPGPAFVDAEATCQTGQGPVDDPWDIVVEREYAAYWDWDYGDFQPSDAPLLPTSPVVAFPSAAGTGRMLAFNGDNQRHGSLALLDVATGETRPSGVVTLGWVPGVAAYTRSADAGGGSVILASAGMVVDPETGEDLAPRGPIGMSEDTRLVFWTEEAPGVNGARHPEVVDLDHDGLPEALINDTVVDAYQGNMLHDVPAAVNTNAPAIADIDLDGVPDLLLDDGIYPWPQGAPTWGPASATTVEQHALPVQADDDPEAEVLFVDQHGIRLRDTDGTLRWEVVLDTPTGISNPVLADFDGDGDAELLIFTHPSLRLYELDGTLKWRAQPTGSADQVAMSGWDVDSDGACEVLANSAAGWFYILDGRTGEERYTLRHLNERDDAIAMPTVADIDQDGHGEIILPEGVSLDEHGQPRSVTILGHAHGEWPPAGPIWPFADFAVTNVNPDGTIPARPEPSWLAWNTWRARPADDRGGSNLSPVLDQVCVDTCAAGGTLSVAAQIQNTGRRPTPDGTTLTLWADDGETSTPLGTWSTPDPVGPGERLEGTVFEVPTDLLPGVALTLHVDDGNANPECDEDDNVVEVANPCG